MLIEIERKNSDIIKHIVTCACGCGEIIVDHNKHGKEIRFKQGHHCKLQEYKDKLSQFQKGRKASDEARKKMSLTTTKRNLGRKQSEHCKMLISEKHRGTHASDETKALLTLAQKNNWENEQRRLELPRRNKERWADPIYKQRVKSKMLLNNRRGEMCNFWQGGISFFPYSSDFNGKKKRKIRERDGNICQLCGKNEYENGKTLAVHHIDYDKKNTKDSNLITLCHLCNLKVNINRNFWKYFFNLLLEIQGKNIVVSNKSEELQYEI